MAKYNWPLPGEGAQSMDLAGAEIVKAIPGLKTYSHAGRADAALAELMAAVFNGTVIPASTITLATLTRLALVNTTLTSSGGSAVTPDVSTATFFSVNVTSTGAYTINNPTNALATSGVGQLVVVQVQNSSGGAITTTFGGNWHLAGGAWTDPANTKSRLAVFVQLNTAFLELARSSADLS
ncbi:MAG TPA: hypothetical protein VJS20_11600 [Gemmatimonadales bacterium]|nr:hypothetical protein [Gemmatimonadales bacterium]